jgi:hypothetical protein
MKAGGRWIWSTNRWLVAAPVGHCPHAARFSGCEPKAAAALAVQSSSAGGQVSPVRPPCVQGSQRLQNRVKLDAESTRRR